MVILIATSGLVVWLLLALVTALTIGAAARLRDRYGVPGTVLPAQAESADDQATAAL